jgi:SAM-dependent methyltransferase
MKSWVDYWNSDHAIYVNDRHKALHATAVGRDILRHAPSPAAVVLDYGSGEALYAEAVAQGVGRLILCDAAPAVREKLAARIAGVANASAASPEAVAALPSGSVDLVVANSLAQYLKPAELASLLDLWRDKLRSDGRLLLADVVPPNVSPVTDAAALLRFAWSGGFLTAALAGLAKTAVSDYRSIRERLGFSTYAPEAVTDLLGEHGYRAERVYPNVGHNQARMTFLAARR